MNPLHRTSNSFSVLAESDRISSPSTAAVAALLVALGTYVGVMAGVATKLPGFGSVVLYPPYAILVTALLLSRPRYWWLLVLASAVAHFSAGWGDWPLRRITISELMNWMRALIAVIGLRRFARRPLFNSLDGLLIFFIFAVVLAPAVATLVGVAAAVLVMGGDYAREFEARFLACALTALTVLPPLLIGVTAKPSRLRRPSRARVLEGSVLCAAILAVSAYAFAAPWRTAAPERLVAPLPLLVWAAVRFGPVGTSLALLALSNVAIFGTLHGLGPFADSSSVQAMLSLHGFLALVAIPLILLATLLREREHVTEALHRNQHRYRLATTAGGVGVWDWTIGSNDIYTDPLIPAALGFSPDEIGAAVDSWRRLIHPDDAAAVSARARDLLDGTTPSFEAEYRMRHKDGSARWCLARGALVRDADGTPRGMIGTQTDITERKHAEESLRASEERTSLAGSAANLGFWQRNLATNAMWLSDHARRIYGLPPDSEITLATVYDLKHPDERTRVRALIDTAVASGTPFETEFRLIRPSGDLRWLKIQGRPQHDEAGTAVYLGGVVMDITEQKQLAIAAEEQAKELAHLGRVAMVGELSTALAHELNQPLTAILSNAQAAKRLLAIEPYDLEQLREILDDVVRDDARAAEVIRHLRLLIQKAEPLFVPLRVADLIDEALAIVRGELLSRGVSVTTEFECERLSVTGDRVQLLQVLLNLLLNACDAMADTPPGDRRLTLNARTDGDERVIISVGDRGPGIGVGQTEKIFEPFVTTKAGGLGLGLAICRSIVSAHEGRLWAANGVGGGALFHLALPARQSAHEDGYQVLPGARVDTVLPGSA